MFTLSLVLFISCVGLSVGCDCSGSQTDIEDYQPIEKQLPECGPNEVLNNCVRCPSEDSCYDRNQIACLAVILDCRVGCVCKEGFIRKTLGRECIPKEECGGPCGMFEQYTECKQSSNETCSSIVSPSNSGSEKACKPGCGCWDGYYRADENSSCQHRCLCAELKDSPDCASWKKSHM